MIPNNISLDDLRSFALLAQTLSFRAAAARAHLSPAAFSDRISKLEDELGILLFTRTTRRVTLTAAGARLLPHARCCIAESDAFLRAAREEVETYELMIGTRYELGLSWLTPALDILHAAHPERILHLHVGDGPDLLYALQHGNIDAMISSLRIDPNEVVSVPLHPEPYVFVARPSVLVERPITGPLDARNHTLCDIAPGAPLFRYLLDRIGGSPWPFSHNEWLGGIGAVRWRVLHGAGVAVLPRYLVQLDLDAGHLIEVLPETPPLSDMFRLSWRPGHPRGDAMVDLAAELQQIPLS